MVLCPHFKIKGKALKNYKNLVSLVFILKGASPTSLDSTRNVFKTFLRKMNKQYRGITELTIFMDMEYQKAFSLWTIEKTSMGHLPICNGRDGSQSLQILLAFLSPRKRPQHRVVFHWFAAHTVTGAVVAAHALSAKVKATAFTTAHCSLEVGVILGR